MPCPFTMLSHDLHTNKPKNMNKEYLKNSSYDLVNRMIILKIDNYSQFSLLKYVYLFWLSHKSTPIINEYPDINGSEKDKIREEFEILLDLIKIDNPQFYKYYTKGGNDVLKNIVDNNITENNIKNDNVVTIETGIETVSESDNMSIVTEIEEDNPELEIQQSITQEYTDVNGIIWIWNIQERSWNISPLFIQYSHITPPIIIDGLIYSFPQV
jgi:hypothetical protein